MRYLHIMVRVNNLQNSLEFYCEKLGLFEVNRIESEEGRFTLVYSAAPRDGYMAFIRSPDNISIELLQKGQPLPKKEPWASMENSGAW